MIADGWNAFMIAIRTRSSLPADIRELAFCRVAALTKAWYEWEIHAPIATDAGLSDKAMAVIKDGKMANWLLAQNTLTDKQLSVLRYADAMTLLTRVPEDVWRGARVHFDDKEMVELTASIAGFNTVARFVTALDVGEMNGKGTVLQE
jgi:alkylhydroperoxidase family enzyme